MNVRLCKIDGCMNESITRGKYCITHKCKYKSKSICSEIDCKSSARSRSDKCIKMFC